MPRTKRSRLRVSVEILSVGVGIFLLLELSTRVYLFGFSALVPERINSVRGLPLTGFVQPSSVPGLPYELRPNLDGYFKMVPFQTNSVGLRDREYALEKPADTFRVAVVGSSFTMPSGVEIERAFHSILEKQLTRERAPLRFEFINFSVGMYNPENLISVIEHQALAYDPDLILFVATKLAAPWLRFNRSAGSDPQPRRMDPKELFATERSYPILRSFLVRLVRARSGARPKGIETAQGLLEGLVVSLMWDRAATTSREAQESTSSSAATRRPTRAKEPGTVIERLARIEARTGVRIAVVRLDYEDTPPNGIDRIVEEQTRHAEIPYLDTRRAFRGTRARDFWIFELDPHPNDRAHAIFATEIGTFLAANDLLPMAIQP